MSESFKHLPISALVPDPNQPRIELESENYSATGANTLQGLASSIREVGMLQPIRVRPVGNMQFMVISGHRRLEAARLLSLEEVPCLVIEQGHDDEHRLVSQVIENLQRKAMKASELAMAVQALVQRGNSNDEVARRLGIQNSQVTLLLNLLKLEGATKSAFERGRIDSPRAAYELTKLPVAVQEQVIAEADATGKVITQREVREVRQQFQKRVSKNRHPYEGPMLSRAEFVELTQCLADGVRDNYDPMRDREAIFGSDWHNVDNGRLVDMSAWSSQPTANPTTPHSSQAAPSDDLVHVPAFSVTRAQVFRMAKLFGWGDSAFADEDEFADGRLGESIAEKLRSL